MEYLNQSLLGLLVTPKTSALAITLAYSMILPAIWLAFCLWLNRNHPRRRGFLAIAFFGGAIAVMPALPLEKFIFTLSTNATLLTILLAACEEILKFGALLFIISIKSRFFNGPRDYLLTAITIGLGFAGLENALYILNPVLAQDITQAAFSGGMRFFGANLLHAVTVSMSGLALGFAYFKSIPKKVWFAFIGVMIAISVHSVFNILIANSNQEQALKVFGLLWIFTLISVVPWIFVIRMEKPNFIKNVWTNSIDENEKIFYSLILKMNITKDDNTPMRDIFLKQKLNPDTSNNHADFEKLCTFLKKSYELRLERNGVSEVNSKMSSSNVISDTISAKTINTVFSLLKEKDQVFTFGKQVIEAHGNEEY
ncbi:MAG: PrsW family glutamic-type intramembrane protease [bacterium]